jgi:cytochrome c-type biogenesis protein CcsB
MSGLFTLGFLAYVCATGLALAYLIQRDELTHRLAVAAALVGWVSQGLGLAGRGAELGRPPLGTLPDALSVAAWVTLGVALWVERRAGLKVLGAFVLPVVLILSASAVARPLGLGPVGRALSGAWVWVHTALALIGIAAFALNFAGAVMYLLQERQLKGKRPGAFYYRLPSLETLDRLTYRTLALGFPFLTTALVLGALWAGTAWGTLWAPDPLAILSLVAWGVYAATLAGRAAAGWHGRRAAYLAVLGFAVLAVTLGAGLLLPGRHGS